jgi:hypothetical protein
MGVSIRFGKIKIKIKITCPKADFIRLGRIKLKKSTARVLFDFVSNPRKGYKILMGAF